MALEDFFDHSCDIFHIQERGASPGYNLPASPEFSYPDEPDIAGLSCHFEVKSQSVTIAQGQPVNLMDAGIKLVLPAGTDVRLNDKIVDCGTGYEYTAEVPHNIRGHHVFVYVRKKDMGRQKDL